MYYAPEIVLDIGISNMNKDLETIFNLHQFYV